MIKVWLIIVIRLSKSKKIIFFIISAKFKWGDFFEKKIKWVNVKWVKWSEITCDLCEGSCSFVARLQTKYSTKKKIKG